MSAPYQLLRREYRFLRALPFAERLHIIRMARGYAEGLIGSGQRWSLVFRFQLGYLARVAMRTTEQGR